MTRATTKRPVTINDVGAAAGVSRQTVTRAMNDMAGISEQTKARVLEAAQRLNYRPSRFGRGLVKGEQHTLGLVVAELSNLYYPELASAIVGTAARHGWSVLLTETVHATDRAAQVAELCAQVDALVGYLDPRADGTAKLLRGLAFAQIDCGSDPTSPGVELDSSSAIGELVDHLVRQGCTQPVLLDLSSSHGLSPRGRRFAEDLRRHGIDLPAVRAEENTLGAGVEAARAALHDHPDTIIAFNDTIACGALKALRVAGVDVPGEVRVTGFDGLQLGTYVTPQLTTLAMDTQAVATAAVELVLAMSAGTTALIGPAAHRTVAYRLVVRESA